MHSALNFPNSFFFSSLVDCFRAEQRKLEEHSNKQKDRQEGEEYRRLAQQYALEQMEIERYRRLRQQDTKTMYDQSLEEKNQVKNMEKILDEVIQ